MMNNIHDIKYIHQYDYSDVIQIVSNKQELQYSTIRLHYNDVNLLTIIHVGHSGSIRIVLSFNKKYHSYRRFTYDTNSLTVEFDAYFINDITEGEFFDYRYIDKLNYETVYNEYHNKIKHIKLIAPYSKEGKKIIKSFRNL